MKTKPMSGAQLEKLADLAETVDNLVHALELPCSDALHVKALRGTLPALRDCARELYVDVAGENPWAES